ncbi:MAG: tripeptidyl peptidase II, partial [Planctomycetaceae bacterium]
SMASPNACGAIALLLSALKMEGVPYSPWSILRALQNTARKVEGADVFAQGPGLLQVDKAHEHLVQSAGATGELLRFQVRVPTRDNARGLYLRETHETDEPLTASVSIRPTFHEDADPREKIEFVMRVNLEANEPWIEAGQHLLLTHDDRQLSVRVDPTQLEPGAHYAELRGLDAGRPERGPLFRLPITVIRPGEKPGFSENRVSGGLPFRPRSPTAQDIARPENVRAKRRALEPETRFLGRNRVSFSGRLAFQPGEIHRRFIPVPAGATWANLVLRSDVPANEQGLFLVHAVQLLPGKTFEDAESRNYVRPARGEDVVVSFAVTGGQVLELCLAEYWTSLDPSQLEYELTFHGLEPDDAEVTLLDGVTRIAVAAPLQSETLDPSATLTTHRTALLPDDATIHPLTSQRDRLPNGEPVYELVLTYTFDQSEPGRVTPVFPANDGLLYDSRLGGQLWMLFDAGRRLVHTDDVWPEEVDLGKGAHTLRLQLRHADASLLEKYKTAPLHLERPLDDAIELAISPTRPAAEAEPTEFPPQSLSLGERGDLYVAAPSPDDLPDDAKPGDVLLGTIHYGRPSESLAGAQRRPEGFPLSYV